MKNRLVAMVFSAYCTAAFAGNDHCYQVTEKEPETCLCLLLERLRLR